MDATTYTSFSSVAFDSLGYANQRSRPLDTGQAN